MFHHKFHTSIGFSALAAGLMLVFGASYPTEAQTPPKEIRFQLYPNKKFLACMAASPYVTPTVNVVVKRGEVNDEMTLALSNFKSGLQFDLFTLKNTIQQANGSPTPNFRNFGLAWYQSDIKIGSNPTQVTIKTILLDQIFGFDPEVNLPPTNTFHVGFWFNNPADAAACGFNGPPTPFNGEQKAGPLGFISRPNAYTGLGPLCSNPNTYTSPPTCNP